MKKDKSINNFMNKLAKIDLNKASLSELFALKLEYIYLSMGISQLDFSLIVNLNLSYFNDIIRAKKQITLKKIDQICSALRIDPIELLNFELLYQMKETNTFIKYPYCSVNKYTI